MGFNPGDAVVTKNIYPEGYLVYKVPAVPGKPESAGRVFPGTIGFVTKMGSAYVDVLFSSGIYGAILVDKIKKVEQ